MKTKLALTFFALSLGLSTVSYADPATEQSTPMVQINQPETKLSITASLFVISSHAAVLENQKHKEMTLTLKNVEPYVMKFTASPDRKASLATTDDVIHEWAHNKNMLANGTPSAALAGIPIKNSKNYPEYILELANPHYDAKHGTLSFQAKWTGGTPAPQGEMTLTNVSLVIDDGLQVALNGKIDALANTFLASIKH